MNLPNLDTYRNHLIKDGNCFPLPIVPYLSNGLLTQVPTSTNQQKLGWPWTEQVDTSLYLQRDAWTKLSIVTPSFNQGQFLEETIRSVLLQNYPNLEYIIIDGGSTDNSVEIIKKYEPWLSYWISEQDRGQAHAINKGLSIATGKYWQWINSDDYYIKNVFVKAIQTLEESSCNTLYAGVFESTDDATVAYYRFSFNVTKEAIIDPKSRFNTDFYYKPEATILSVNISQILNGVREDFNNIFDTDFMIRYTQYANPIYIEEVIIHYRIHPLTKTIANSKNIYEEYFKMLEEQNFSIGSKYWFRLLFKKAAFISTKDQKDSASIYELIILAIKILISCPYVIISRAYWGIWRKILISLLIPLTGKITNQTYHE
jgi:glycosyltransferase involved in cell wall biosynthesis